MKYQYGPDEEAEKETIPIRKMDKIEDELIELTDEELNSVAGGCGACPPGCLKRNNICYC